MRYNKPLDPKLMVYGGNLNLKGYDHPLPEGLTTIGGWLDIGVTAIRCRCPKT